MIQCNRTRNIDTINDTRSINIPQKGGGHFYDARVVRHRVGSSRSGAGRERRCQRRFSRDPLAADKRRPIYEQREKRNFFKLGLK